MAMLQHYNKDFCSAQDIIMTFLYKHPGKLWHIQGIMNILRKEGYDVSNVDEVHIILLDLRYKELIGVTDELMIYYLD